MVRDLSFCIGGFFRKPGVLVLKVFLLLFAPANLVLQESDMPFLDQRAPMLGDKLLQLSKDGDVHKSTQMSENEDLSSNRIGRE